MKRVFSGYINWFCHNFNILNTSLCVKTTGMTFKVVKGNEIFARDGSKHSFDLEFLRSYQYPKALNTLQYSLKSFLIKRALFHY